MTNLVPRIAILHQGCVPNYRDAFYRRLAVIPYRRYVVIHGDPEPGSGIIAASPPLAFDHIAVRNRFLKIAGRSLVYQPVFWRIARGNYDAIVVGHEVKYFVSIVLLLWFRLLGKPALFWGFGTGQDFWDEKRGGFGKRMTRLINRAKAGLTGLASGYLAYTASGAAMVVRAGMSPDRVTVLNNTIDLDAEIAGHKRALGLDRTELRREYGIAPDATVFTFVGRLLAGKKVEDLIRVGRKLRLEIPNINIEMLIIGDGPERERLEAEAQGESWCRFLGAVHDVDNLSRIFRVTDALTIPGYVGLAVNRAFAHGVPLITIRSAWHSPEIDYVKDGVNGLILETTDFQDGLARFAADPDLRRRLRDGALATRETLDLGRMVAAFDGAVAAALKGVSKITPGSLPINRRHEPDSAPQ
jgi:glycosyltransferase involved in cell wall biosynthesis